MINPIHVLYQRRMTLSRPHTQPVRSSSYVRHHATVYAVLCPTPQVHPEHPICMATPGQCLLPALASYAGRDVASITRPRWFVKYQLVSRRAHHGVVCSLPIFCAIFHVCCAGARRSGRCVMLSQTAVACALRTLCGLWDQRFPSTPQRL